MLQIFLTFWVFILVVFHNYSRKIFSLSFLTFIVMCMGLYISYINPGKYYINYNGYKIIIAGYTKLVIDIYFHIIPFFFIYFTYGIESFFDNWKIIPSILLIILYNLLYCPEKIYNIPKQEIIIISFMGLLLYILLTIKLNQYSKYAL
jgi:hypothetical protein